MRHERIPEEIDSYLYQTVGQDAIEFVAQALDVPLYRKTIDGTAVEQGSEYGGRTASTSCGVRGDETEDLFDLLYTVKVCGFVLYDVPHLTVPRSTTPIFRVFPLVQFCRAINESAWNTCRSHSVPPRTRCSFCFRCRRLSLTVLAYLWQREQDELLQEMIDAGLVAVIMKVAGIGLTEKHLGKTLAEMQPTLVKLVRFLRRASLAHDVADVG